MPQPAGHRLQSTGHVDAVQPKVQSPQYDLLFPSATGHQDDAYHQD